ncbi:MAG: hypothetical protein AB7V58_08180 [Solirubrobacterales bacterium]
MALPPADPARHRRQQRRRALIGWIGAALIVAGVVVAAIAGGGERGEETSSVPAHVGGLFDITSGQFDDLHTGETEDAVLDQLGKSGSPEGQTPIGIIALFPTHDDSVECSYWLISDAEETAARLCFSRPGAILRQKLERDLSEVIEGEGESSIRA